MKIIVSNVGSTSLKTKVFDAGGKNGFTQLAQADLDRVLTAEESTFRHSVGGGRKQVERVDVFGFEDALKLILRFFLDSGVISSYVDIDAVGFKTILAGNRGASILTDEVISEMKRYAFVSPTHNLPYIHTIANFRALLGAIPLVGVFEPSFHHTIPRYRRLSGLPLALEEKLGLEQRGYHGATGRYGAERARQLHQQFTMEMGSSFPSPFKLIYNHLGGSSSTHAIMDGISVATSMKFSNQSGHFQGTRIGDIDGYALLYAMRETGFTLDEMNELMSKQSGLRGISGIASGEMSDILEAAAGGDWCAQLARDAFIDSVIQYIGAYAAVLNGVDAIVFAGGIGENATALRASVCASLGYLNLELDPDKNTSIQGREGRISRDTSKVQVYVVQTDEESVVAYFTHEVVRLGRDILPEEMHFQLTNQ